MKLGTVIPYLKKTQKYMNNVTHSLSSADISIFTILIMSPKLATPGLLKTKVMRSYFLTMMQPTKFYHLVQIILYMWSCDQSLVNLAFLWEKLS